MILVCKCESPGQDAIHGKGRRVHNKTAKDTWRCTICRNEAGGLQAKKKGKW